MSDALIAAAGDEARRLEHGFIGTEHLLLALLRAGDPSILAVLGEAGVSAEAAQGKLEHGRRGRRPPVKAAEDGSPGLTTHAKRALDAAGGDAARLVATMRADRGSILSRMVERPAAADAPPESPRSDQRPAQVKAEPAPPATPQPKRERKERPPKPPREERPRERNRPVATAPRPPANDFDDEPPFVPRLAVQPRKQFTMPWRLLLLLLVPATIVLSQVGTTPLILFLVACLGVLPLASYMGDATAHLAARSGPTVGGLVSATLGNAAGLIIAVVALNAGMVELVKASIAGSILANLLLILGLSFLAGGMKQPGLRFNRTSAGISSSMLALSVAALVVPGLLHLVHPRPAEFNVLLMSEAAAIILGLAFLGSLLYSLKTRKRLLDGEVPPPSATTWGVGRAVVVLALAAMAVVFQSGVLLAALEQVTLTLGWSEFFLGLIVIPIIGSAAQHSSAIFAARKGLADLALQVTLGSSTQIALVVAPILVGVGLLVGQRMDLVFQPLAVAGLAMATFVTALIVRDGESHWFEGVQLLAVYALLGAAAWFI